MGRVKALNTADDLAKAIGQATRSSQYCLAGSLACADPELVVDGLGVVRFPLKPAGVKKLVAQCQVAPYGKGTKTLVDTKVRKTFELDPRKFRLGEAWSAEVARAARLAAGPLGLPADQVEVSLYKLLVYEKDGFFLPHRDSEKLDRMVASLIVVLPNPFEGGRLIVRHGKAKEVLTFAEAASGKAPCFAAFYADCEHEVERVSRGVRVALAYNLVLKPGTSSNAPKRAAPADRLSETISGWVARQPAKPLVFALEHHYTQRGLSPDLLKGADRNLVDLVVAAAEDADCLVHLAQVSRHLSQYADDGSFEESCYSRRSYRPQRRRAIEIGETYEDELIGTEWADLDGDKLPWGSIAFDKSAIVSSTPIDDWKPTSEEFEGYTGNEGNTLDRWYHRSAVVVWHRDHHYDVVASSGAASCIPLFCSMATKLAKTPANRRESARTDCIRFARAIVARWSRRHGAYVRLGKDGKSALDDFSKSLLTLNDPETAAAFLSKIAEQDDVMSIEKFVVAACRQLGWATFAKELKLLLAARPKNSWRTDLPLRNIEWLAAFCCDPSTDPARLKVAAELCPVAVDRFCEPRAGRSGYGLPRSRRELSTAEKSLPLLLQALAATVRDDDLARVIDFVRELPDEFSVDDCQVPTLKTLIPWSRKRFGSVHPRFQAWRDALTEQLERAAAQQPTPPTDWARPAKVDCTCQHCRGLKAFLADPARDVERFPAREDMRQHLIATIEHTQCDVKHALDRKGSPYSLVLTKTTASHDRAVQRYEKDRQLLKALRSIT